MGISDRIEAFICELMKEDDGWVELGRNELAGIFNCVPSQINYVMRTRFTPERGYIIESRRGGGGYLKIRRVAVGAEDIIGVIPDEVTVSAAAKIIRLAEDSGVLDKRSAKAALGGVLCDRINDEQRSAVLKAMLDAVLKD
ncbi:MAG: CtsR family transcriptional regulator [Clostridia bacterium]|nr:CtsR family transcriptional regulator [Clostridia bacterium]